MMSTNTILTIVLLCTITILFKLLSSNIPKVVVDVDAGTDDYQALVVLLNADYKRQIKIEAIFCVNGNTKLKYVEKNVIRLLEVAGRLDIPVYRGARSPLRQPEEVLENWFGADGFGDVHDWKKEPDVSRIQDCNAIVAFHDYVIQNTGDIILVATAPLTNIAITAIMYEDFLPSFKEIWIMGGNYGEDRVEFNFLGDPEAAKVVLEMAKVPITILTWQACGSVNTNLDWRFSIVLSNPIWNLGEKAERSQFKEASLTDQYNVCDTALAMCFINPKLIMKQSKHCASVQVKDDGRGKVIIKSDCKFNVNIIETVDSESYQKQFVEEFKKACDSGKCQDVY